VYLIFVLHGVGTLMPWNMFITAKEVKYSQKNHQIQAKKTCSFQYFVDYKLSEDYTGIQTNLAANFLAYVGLTAQIPNLIFNWANILWQAKR
jgi:solute carrier family 29 (equilibrative nucleoside transporter), member 1/2/3